MVLWQFSSSPGSFITFSILFGLTAGGFVSLLPVITGDIVGVENIQRGIGMIYLATVAGDLLGTPIVGLLRDAFDWTAAIQFAGSANMAAALFLLALRMDIAYGHVFVKI